MDHLGDAESGKSWMLNVNNRYFKSFRHFVGTEEQEQRVEDGTDVRNYAYSADISITRNFTRRFSASIAIPFNHNVRTSLYEHGGQARYKTNSAGLGDISLTAYTMMFDPAKGGKGNIQLGLGVKLPTGNYKYKDKFHTSGGSEVEGPVDQSIQLGDGGTGIRAEMNAHYSFSSRVNIYSTFFYMANPRERNGVSSARGGTPSAAAIAYTTDIMSVPDQYMIRAGVNVTHRNVTMAMGVRDEGLPAHDMIGGNRGFRRPGYIISADPGIIVKAAGGKANIYAYCPVALVRNRTQSYPDELRSKATSTNYKGDAAFSDYTLNVGMSLSFR
jgi:hypothetical protein